MPTASSGCGNGWASGCGGTTTVPPMMLTSPIATIPSASTTKAYVGTAKMLPDSRSPRRLAIVISEIDTNAISMRMS